MATLELGLHLVKDLLDIVLAELPSQYHRLYQKRPSTYIFLSCEEDDHQHTIIHERESELGLGGQW